MMSNTLRFTFSLIAMSLAAYAYIRFAYPVAGPVPPGASGVEAPATGIDWTAVAALVASIAAGVEAIFAGITRLVAMFRKKQDATDQ